MAEVLSQDEIDALLKNISTEKTSKSQAGDGKDNVYLYDFKHPNRVSKDQLRNLRTIHESFARMLGTYLTTLLRTMVDVHLLSIDQVTFLEFTMAMSNPGCIWIFGFQNHEGKGILEINPDLVLLTIERIFGGEGKHSGELRPLSVIEQNVAGKIVERILQIYDEAWAKAYALQTQLVGFEINPQFAQVAPSSETAVVHFLEINIRETTFPMNICLPYFILDPIIQKLSADNWLGHTAKNKTGEEKRKIEGALKNSQVILSAELGQSHLTIEELLSLDIDDVVVLDRNVDDLLKLKVGSKARYLGKAGISGKKLVVRIADSCDNEG